MSSMMMRTVVGVLVLGASACGPNAPPVDKPPEPQATQLRDAIKAPIDRANAVQDTVSQAAEQQQATIDAAAH